MWGGVEGVTRDERGRVEVELVASGAGSVDLQLVQSVLVLEQLLLLVLVLRWDLPKHDIRV